MLADAVQSCLSNKHTARDEEEAWLARGRALLELAVSNQPTKGRACHEFPPFVGWVTTNQGPFNSWTVFPPQK